VRQLHLGYTAPDAIGDQLFVAFGACLAQKDLRNHIAVFVIAVGVHRRHRADTASGSPGTRTCMICCSDALAAFDQRPNFTATIDNGFQTLEHKHNPSVLQSAHDSAFPLLHSFAAN
jgi:hypothetical protein